MGLLVKDNQYISTALALVDQAKKEICISSFKLEIRDNPVGRALKNFFERIAQKRKEGVKVNVLFNWHDNKRAIAKTNYSVGLFLKNAGADVRYLQMNRCCHAKLLIIDKEKVLLGSHNLSIRSCQNNFELSYIIPDPETVEEIYSVFQHSFYDGKKF